MTQTLKGLLEQAKVKRGVTSGRALAELTAARQYKIDRTQVNQILGGTYRHKPGHELIKAIAWLAGVDESVAYEAAGAEQPSAPFVEELPPDVDYLSPQQRHAVITVIRAFLGAAEEGGRAHGNAAAMNDPRQGELDGATVTPLSERRSNLKQPPAKRGVANRTKRPSKRRGDDD